MTGHGLEVVRAVVAGGAVDQSGAGLLQMSEVPILAHVLRGLEHHVFEEVCEARAAGAFLQRANVVPDADRSERKSAVLVENDGESVLELVLLEGDLQGASLGRASGRAQGDEHGEREGPPDELGSQHARDASRFNVASRGRAKAEMG